ncbi:hypothetical protein PT974_04433 [Cladobotryum mycophilum]|uniref:P-loop containing nucleoside triphosphate hydrolase protein n=1 Tax=Cladobotryum mycophilum TaxID=491253 RepID=A0ABR0SUZ3_9HYPO
MALRKVRLLDQEPVPDGTKPVQVLCLGMCRTGTTSLLETLTQLGYTPIHMQHIIENTDRKRLWIEAIESTFIDQKPYGRAEFDILLQGFDATLDIPAAIFAEQLVKAYPEAKVILTTRSVDSWIRSMNNTVWQHFRWPSYRILSYIEPEFMGTIIKLLDLIFYVHSKNKYDGPEAEQAFLAHNQRVREMVPAKNLLELSPPFDMEKLCGFLDKPLPSSSYPHVNNKEEFIQKVINRRNKSMGFALRRLGKTSLMLVPILGLLWYIWV